MKISVVGAPIFIADQLRSVASETQLVVLFFCAMLVWPPPWSALLCLGIHSLRNMKELHPYFMLPSRPF